MADLDSLQMIGVPGKSCLAYGCQMKWGLGNQLFVFADSSQKPSKDKPSSLGSPEFIHEANWDTDMHTPVARKLVNEAHDIFISLQNNVDTEDKQYQMLKHSAAYRSIIKACVMDIQLALKQCTSEDDRMAFETQLQLFEAVELIWSFCEILYVSVLPAGALISQLQQWMRLHFTESDRLAHEALRGSNPQNAEGYWPAVYGLIFQGRITEALQVLSVHPERDSEHFKLIEQLLRRMPVYAANSGLSIGEFENKWRYWQEECVERLRDGSFMAHPCLEVICQILCGEDEVFAAHSDLLGTWYCLMVARLFYQNPAIKVFDLQYATQFCVDAYGGLSNLQPWDSILLAAVEFDIHQVIRECSSSFGNWWFASHLTDLLQHCGKLESHTLHFGSTLREFLLLEFATSLLSHHSLWQIGILYLDHCSEFGRFYIEEFVERIPIETERKAQKVLKICEERDLQPQIRSICKSMGMRSLHNKHLGAALSWSLRSKDVNFVTFIAEKFLNEYSESGGFIDLEVLDHLGSSMLLSSKLTFLGKYREFHRLYEEREFKAAASLLLALLTAKIAPPRFGMTLLLDALPLLQSESIIFTSEETYELMHCLEEINISRRLKAKKAAKDDAMDEDVDKEKLDLMKLGLARNLARAIVHEGTNFDMF
ncbi:hypothetical protein CAPTEDRAFT_228245 [Capitella teleta]|uniref:Nuclear pore complex protein Nup85 n=1 Tax=Capitella teleta TaxID=283909 RepID=R7TLZ8_CAPTE|nr:hypothetical protein CAPTEDRAFT_228245 [Capitella teleta]|eukprot:ELT92130.1 hypothetical protein CAPTEDRAFT_228245 [Capitella teleta]